MRIASTRRMILWLWAVAAATVQDPVPSPGAPSAPSAPSAASVVQAQDPAPLGPGPNWRGPVRPTGRNEVFATGDGCAMCHSVAATAKGGR